mmetsp:Transcript_9546/g.14643  ORF Transcript_9546/g.14643 Transcript_9546/m.14643 type:complete len:321 (+) Transcript_9546:2-964(+)
MVIFIGSLVFTACVGVQLAVDIRSLPFWMLTISGILFCGGSIFFIRAFAHEAPTEVLYKPKSEKLPPPQLRGTKSRCLQCTDRHCGSNLLIASWLFLLACVPVVVASIAYVVHHDDRLYFWGVLGGSIAFCVASGFFVVASYPEHLGKRNDHLPGLVANAGILDHAQARTHCGSEWLVSNWCFLILTAGWLFTSIFFILVEPSQPDYQFSALEALIYFIASVYFVKGSYVAQAEATAAQFENDKECSSNYNTSGEEGSRSRIITKGSMRPSRNFVTGGVSFTKSVDNDSNTCTLQQPGVPSCQSDDLARGTTNDGSIIHV